MRGEDRQEQPPMWSYVPLEQRVPPEHPLLYLGGKSCTWGAARPTR